MIQGKKFRIYPTTTQQQTLLQWIGCQRFIYNAKVGEDRYFRRFARKSLSLCGIPVPLDQKYSQFITQDTFFLKEVPSQVLRNGAYRFRDAYQKYKSGAVSGRPKIKKKHGRQSVLLTRELFSFQIENDIAHLALGTKKFPVGEILMKQHLPVPEAPASISISVDAGRWFVSFATDDGVPDISDAELAADLKQLSEGDLLQQTVGVDRGVAIPAASSNGIGFALFAHEQKKLERAERHKKRWQRIAARRVKGSKRQKKALRRAARLQRYQADVRKDFAHKTSRALVDTDVRLIVFEDLKIKNMTRSAKGTIEQPGKKVKQKSGLNRSILQSSWGLIETYSRYKARRDGKLVISVKPHRSSQECRLCGDIRPENRISQSVFLCLRCGHHENADFNAAGVIKQRGVTTLLAGEIQFKQPRKSGIRKQLGLGRPEVTLGGEDVSRMRQPSQVQTSLNREETPTTTASAV
ncbi:MAG: transposase [Desulfuromonas thiophila]|jgi:putative transposase|nr:transposase [Desulfuromonas thiophila]